ncbi:hypothetical protein R6H26_13305 [Altericista sp. CCNU0014]
MVSACDPALELVSAALTTPANHPTLQNPAAPHPMPQAGAMRELTEDERSRFFGSATLLARCHCD